MRFNHIGFLSKDIEAEADVFSRLFPGTVWSDRIVDPIQDVTARFGRTPQGVVYELVEANSETSPIYQALKARKNILNHVCYSCDNLVQTSNDLRSQGFFPVTEAKPGIAFGDNPIQFFFHPNGLLMELVEGDAGPFNRAAGPDERNS
jgi:hypothetical protein